MMVTGDGAYIKKINRSLILQNIIEHGFISRAELSKITGLNKATISVQVVDLLDENLVCETQQEHHAVGRRPIMLSINGEAGYVLGIDLDYEQIKYRISDLQGNMVYTETVLCNTDDYDESVNVLIKLIQKYKKKYAGSHYGLVQTIIGIHGTVNNDETIFFVPKLQWHSKNLKGDLEKALDMNISIENNANLSSFAERVYKHHHSNNLLTLILSSGIGAGIMIDGKLHKGYDGYAGEMGHMVIWPDGRKCRCGNHGCWELYAAERVVYSSLAEKLSKSSCDFDDLKQLTAENDPTTREVMKTYIKHVSIGLNNIINLYNPETLVINSELLKLYPNAVEELEEYLISSVSSYREIVLSDLGSNASVMGACALAIQNFFEVSEIVFFSDED
ncbi:ROK family transcriptional regulator [Oceanobacillus saliphilus]|uniref:ROK family transcriptional regulator n=1 Tax=Oceanobacillus saliphilus TaxID=2925834 RepID=UPI00201E59AC|nr:ROK family transcriptional regulator [Oceanobacillus saliphilus]